MTVSEALTEALNLGRLEAFERMLDHAQRVELERALSNRGKRFEDDGDGYAVVDLT